MTADCGRARSRSPAPQVPSSVRHPVEGAPWPVMVWFFPGGFTSGTASMREYAPEYLVARGVVVVSVNYRLGAFGGSKLQRDSYDSSPLPLPQVRNRSPKFHRLHRLIVIRLRIDRRRFDLDSIVYFSLGLNIVSRHCCG